METNTHRLTELMDLGIHFNLKLIGDKKSGGFLKQIEEFDEGTEIAYWLILREMGTNCVWLNNAKHQAYYSKDISTITFGDYFYYHKISFLFQELNRITNGLFTYQVIEEFPPLFDSNHNKANPAFWDKVDALKGNFVSTCKYEILGEEITLNYTFFNGASTYLNPLFVQELVDTIQAALAQLNISCLAPEEFITFLVADQNIKNKLAADFAVNFYKKELPIPKKKETEINIPVVADKATEIQRVPNKKWWEFWK